MTIRFSLRVLGRELPLTAAVPAGPTRPRRLLPVLHQLTAALTEAALEREAAAGRQLSCRAGCGACCRQLVPITEPEALRLREVMKEMPAERRQAVLERFAAAQQRLAAAGVLADLAAPTDKAQRQALDQASFYALAARYVAAQVPCPFLEDESCSIHRDRPLVCREFLVTSPAAYCAEQPPRRVERVPLPGKPSAALARVQQRQTPGTTPGERTSPWVPLVQALDFAASYRDPAQPLAGPELLRALIAEL